MRLEDLKLFFFITMCIHMGEPYAYEYTVVIERNAEECFYQPAEKNTHIELEYQVLDGSHTNFVMKSPTGEILAGDVRLQTNTYELTLQEQGIYEMCIHNMFVSHPQQVFFEIYSDQDDPSFPLRHQKITDLENSNSTDEYEEDVSVSSMTKSFDGVSQQIDKMKFLQKSIRTYNIKDRYVQEDNFTRVNTFSAIQLFVMVAVTLVQVYMIRSLFNTDAQRPMKVAT